VARVGVRDCPRRLQRRMAPRAFVRPLALPEGDGGRVGAKPDGVSLQAHCSGPAGRGVRDCPRRLQRRMMPRARVRSLAPPEGDGGRVDAKPDGVSLQAHCSGHVAAGGALELPALSAAPVDDLAAGARQIQREGKVAGPEASPAPASAAGRTSRRG
jgi:hypothetical protein